MRLDRKFPQFQQNEIFSLSDAFQRLDVDDKGYIDEATAIKSTQQSENQPYDVVRQALKEVELDSSRRVELEDYVGVCANPPRIFPIIYSDVLTRKIAHCKGSRIVVQTSGLGSLSPCCTAKRRRCLAAHRGRA
jgi:hypothetical protein